MGDVFASLWFGLHIINETWKGAVCPTSLACWKTHSNRQYRLRSRSGLKPTSTAGKLNFVPLRVDMGLGQQGSGTGTEASGNLP